MLDNKTLEKQFKLLADLEDLHQGDGFKANAYRRAAEVIKTLTEPYNPQHDPPQGIGKGLHTKIIEAMETNVLPGLNEYLQQTPKGIIELMGVSGLGPKRVAKLWEAGYTSPSQVLDAANNGQLAQVNGFGKKTAASLTDALQLKVESAGKLLLSEGLHWAELVTQQLAHATQWPIDRCQTQLKLSGQLRLCLPIISKIELVWHDTENNFDQLTAAFKQAEGLNYQPQLSGIGLLGFTLAECPCAIQIRCAQPQSMGSVWLRSTGPASWLAQNNLLDAARTQTHSTEQALFEAANLPYCPPEMRHELIEYQKINIEQCVTNADVKGVLHAHSTYSDGAHTLAEMAEACQQKGYQYLGITDHSQSAFYAGGLKEEDVERQHAEIDQLNEKLSDFKILKGIESDILADGSLDYPDSVLKTFDFVIASVHSVLNMDIDKATDRLIKAIENPYTHILGHCTARLLLRRHGYPLHMHKVIDACAANKVSIEINANPRRLDIDYTNIPYCLAKGVQISINPDAHHTDGIDDIPYGVMMARKGGLTKPYLLNRLNPTELLEWFKK